MLGNPDVNFFLKPREHNDVCSHVAITVKSEESFNPSCFLEDEDLYRKLECRRLEIFYSCFKEFAICDLDTFYDWRELLLQFFAC